jgi:hypothetical protein
LLGRHLEYLSRPGVVGSKDLQFSLALSQSQIMGSGILGREKRDIDNVFKVSDPVELDHISPSVASFDSVTHIPHSSTVMHREVTLAEDGGRYYELNMDVQISG